MSSQAGWGDAGQKVVASCGFSRSSDEHPLGRNLLLLAPEPQTGGIRCCIKLDGTKGQSSRRGGVTFVFLFIFENGRGGTLYYYSKLNVLYYPSGNVISRLYH